MQIYHYHPHTRAFLGAGLADPDPLQTGQWLIPAHATHVPPPECDEDAIQVFTPETESWDVVPDHRGRTWYRKADGRAVIIDAIGQPDASLTDQTPAHHSVWDPDAGAWVPDMELLRAAKFTEIRTAFAAASLEPVHDGLGRVWHGGIDSALKLDGAWRLAERSGASEVSFYDTGNQRHHLDLAYADAVVRLVAGRYQDDFGRKQALMVAAAAAASVEELESITW